jgi:intein-encoded DNA endonuclease-like protein
MEATRINETIAYLAGASEDARLGQGGKEGYVFDIESKSERWLTEIVKPALEQELLDKQVQVKPRKTRPEYRIQVWDKHLVELIRTIHDNPEVIRTWKPSHQRAWLQGLADAEGSATQNSEGQPQFSIYNQSLQKLKIAGEILENNHIHCGYYKPPTRTVWQLYITGRENLKRFLRWGPGVTHPEKHSQLLQYLTK